MELLVILHLVSWRFDAMVILSKVWLLFSLDMLEAIDCIMVSLVMEVELPGFKDWLSTKQGTLFSFLCIAAR
jgi:hypothetical protein